MSSLITHQSSSPTKKVVIYGRVSTANQTVENQLHDLRQVAQNNGWEIVDEYLETVSGTKSRNQRKEFDRLMKDGVRGKFQMILAWDVSRLGRSLKTLVEFMEDIQNRNIDLYLHQNGIDTSTSSGRAMFQMIGIFSEFERSIISDRIKTALDRVRSEGKKLGRPTNYNDGMKNSIRLLRDGGMSIKKIAVNLEIGIGTVYRALGAVA
jgi:DNA invertase Pin-like site-specific DNA recombinase